MKKWVMGSIGLNLLFLAITGVLIWKMRGVTQLAEKLHLRTPKYHENIFYQERVSLFEQVTIPENAVVFLGDSLTQKTEWNELFPGETIINRGIMGDTTEGVLHRLDPILDAKPRKLFLMIGTNDVGYHVDLADSKRNYRKILSSIQRASPETTIYVESVLPVNSQLNHGLIDNEQIVELNQEIQSLAAEFSVQYIDVHARLVQKGELPASLTSDGIHLMGKGYTLWSEELRKYVSEK